MSTKESGTVKWFDTKKGFGFIVNEAGEDCMVHYRAIQQEGFKNLKEGDAVEFVQVKSEKGWQAHEVVVLEPA